MLPFSRMYQRRRRRCIGGSISPLVGRWRGSWPVVVVPVLLAGPRELMAQSPQLAIPIFTGSHMSATALTSLPYAVAAVLAAIAFLIVFNQKLQREVRERKQAEAQLRASEREKAVLLDSIDERVVYLDTEQRLLWANRSARNHPQPITDKVFGQHCFEIWGDSQGPCDECPVPQTLAAGVARHNNQVQDPDGRCWRVQAYPVRGEGGGLKGVVVISRDVTQTLARQEELLRTRKLESIGVLAGGIAHDFNNMLTAVMGYISLAELKETQRQKRQRYLGKATAAANRAKQLAARLLTFSQGGHPVRREVAVEALLAKAAGEALGDSPISVRMDVDPQCHSLWCDEVQILQAVENVIVNACESMPDGGEILVQAECTQIEEGTGDVLLPGGYLRIGISDRGAGISADMAEKIFDPYFTTKPMGAEKGCGLGLAITHSIVQKHQGYVSVTPRAGGGTTVHLFLPLDAADPLRCGLNEATDARGQRRANKRILVLEDEPLVWEVAEMLLTHLGYTATHAPHGEAAVELYREALASERPFDTVILDLTIKGGMGGRKTIEALRRLDPGVRAFVSSGYSSDPVLTDYQRYGFSGVIPKPYTLDEVSQALAPSPGPSTAN